MCTHNRPRRALLTPRLVDHGPQPQDLEDDRATHSTLIDETEGASVLRDEVVWDQKPDALLGSTGQGRKRVSTIPFR